MRDVMIALQRLGDDPLAHGARLARSWGQSAFESDRVDMDSHVAESGPPALAEPGDLDCMLGDDASDEEDANEAGHEMSGRRAAAGIDAGLREVSEGLNLATGAVSDLLRQGAEGDIEDDVVFESVAEQVPTAGAVVSLESVLGELGSILEDVVSDVAAASSSSVRPGSASSAGPSSNDPAPSGAADAVGATQGSSHSASQAPPPGDLAAPARDGPPEGWVVTSDGNALNEEGRFIGKISGFGQHIACRCKVHRKHLQRCQEVAASVARSDGALVVQKGAGASRRRHCH